MASVLSRAGVVSVAAGFACAASAQQVVVPNSFATVEGPGNNSYPFTIHVKPSQRYQQVHASSEFSALAGPHQLREIRVRPDAQFAFPAWTASTTIDMRFSTTQSGPDQLSTTFAQNVGPDETIVYSGPVMYGTNQTSSGTVPGPWAFDISIPFQTPFVYDPSRGHLLMDVRRDGNPLSQVRPLDSVGDTPGDSVSRGYSDSSAAPIGFVDSAGLIVLFVFSPVGGGCYPNCDQSTTAPILNVQDFTCFLQRYAAGESYANCDESTTAPVLNVQDFTCFLQRYAAGCP
jgi:hypothetical protein